MMTLNDIKGVSAPGEARVKVVLPSGRAVDIKMIWVQQGLDKLPGEVILTLARSRERRTGAKTKKTEDKQPLKETNNAGI